MSRAKLLGISTLSRMWGIMVTNVDEQEQHILIHAKFLSKEKKWTGTCSCGHHINAKDHKILVKQYKLHEQNAEEK